MGKRQLERRIAKPFFVILTIAIAISLIGFATIGFIVKTSLPDITKLKGCFVTSMNNVYLCKGSENYVTLENVSDKLIQALIISEDSTFFHHGGFDWSEIKESIERNLSRGKLARGGSTITQQIAKNAFLSSEKSFMRKFREALISYKIENTFTKKDILEKYLNIVEFGKNLYGIYEASQYYFFKHPSDLNWAESFFLIHLLPSPEIYSQGFRNHNLTAFNEQRIREIFSTLKRYGKIEEEEIPFVEDEINAFIQSHRTLGEQTSSNPSNGDIADEETWDKDSENPEPITEDQ